MFPSTAAALKDKAARTQLLIYKSRVDFDQAVAGEQLCLLGGCAHCQAPVDQAYQTLLTIEFGSWVN